MTQTQITLCHRFAAIARAEIGIHEIPGKAANARIVAYLRTTTLPESCAEEDETPWCSAFVNWVVTRTGCSGTDRANARSWLEWGAAISKPVRGAVVVLRRGHGWQGHVGFWLADEGQDILVLGGNQGDAVDIRKFPKSQVLGYRVPLE